FPATMSAANPVTIVVNGDLTLSAGAPIGYGILVVTGTLTYDPSISWNGIVLVIGTGHLVAVVSGSTGGTGFTGAVVVAKSLMDDGITPWPQPTPGPSSSDQSGGGTGFFYSSCWIKAVQNPVSFKILSFR